jgi:uncharacterized protein YndB with AHSA1/START domain
MSDSDVVHVSVEVPKTPEIVFPYFTDPTKHVEWMGSQAHLEPTPGGIYALTMGDGFAVGGTFLQVEPPHLLAFTWGWAPGAGRHVRTGPQPDDLLPPGSSRVEVTLTADNGDATIVTLTHHDLTTDDLRTNHHIAWETYLQRLRTLLAGHDPGNDPHT